MKKQFLTGVFAVGAMTVGTLVQAEAAQALSFGFSNIFPNGGNVNGDAIVGQFSGSVQNSGSDILFKISNTGSTASSITQVVFENPNNLLSNFRIAATSQVNGLNFDAITPAGNLSQSNNIPGFTGVFEAQRDNLSGSADEGVNPGQTLEVLFSGNLAAVEAALLNGTLRLGLHVQSIDPSTQSDSFVSSAAIPTPALLPGLIGMGVAALRKKQAGEASDA